MINWINGHLVFGFKALVLYDGIFNTVGPAYTTEVRLSNDIRGLDANEA